MCQRAGEREEARAAECEEERGKELGSTGQSYTRTRRKQKSSRKRNQNSHSFWTRRERGKTCPKLRWTHWEGKEHFCWKRTPNSTTMSHLQTPKPTTMSHCPQVTPLSLGSHWDTACWPHERVDGRAQHFQPGNATEARKKEKCPRSPALWQTPSCPRVSSGRGPSSPGPAGCPWLSGAAAEKGSVRRERVNCPRSLLSLPGLWNNQR